MNNSMAEKRIRSAKAPTMIAGVRQAIIIWNATKQNSGIATPALNVGTAESTVTPPRNAFENPPISPE